MPLLPVSCVSLPRKTTSCWQRCHLVGFRAVPALFLLGWCVLCVSLGSFWPLHVWALGSLLGGEHAEYAVTSQFIVTLARGPSCGWRCSIKSRCVETAWKMERAVSIWPGFVCGGVCGARMGSCIPPPGLSGEVDPSEEMMQRHSQPDGGVGLGSPGLICWRVRWSGRHLCRCPAIYRESRIQGFPQAAQILKTANYSSCSFLSLGLFMHLKWAVKGILCIRQTFALEEAGLNKAPSH